MQQREVFDRKLKQLEADLERQRSSRRRKREQEIDDIRQRQAQILREERVDVSDVEEEGEGSYHHYRHPHHHQRSRWNDSERKAKRKREMEEDAADREAERQEKLNKVKAQKEMLESAKIKSVKSIKSNIFAGGESSDEEEEDQNRKLVPIEYTREEQEAVAHLVRDQKKKIEKHQQQQPSVATITPLGIDSKMAKPSIQELLAQVPLEKEAVFSYPINWSVYKEHLNQLASKWVLKKTVELLGEEEQSLCEFIISKLAKESIAACDLVNELEPILEDESEVFVLKLYRMIIFEQIKHLNTHTQKVS